MIQLASDSTASRMNFRPAANDGKGHPFEIKQVRSGHAWPFLSRESGRPAPQGTQKNPSNDSGS